MKIVIKDSKVEWTVPSYQEEMGEFDRYNFSDEEKKELYDQFSEKNLVSLKDDIWKRVNNTDSWDTTSIEDVERLADEYGKNFNSILKAFKKGKSLPAPIILHKDDKYELIAGNTRLMVARALSKRPKVLMIKLGENK